VSFDRNKLALITSVASAAFLIFLAGLVAGRYRWFPTSFLELAVRGARELRAKGDTEALPWFYRRLPPPLPAAVTRGDGVEPGLNLVTRLAANEELAAEIMDMEGRVRHRWNVDWFSVWPDATHLPDHVQPRRKMETHIHGAVVMPNGDLVYNYEHLGLVRLSRDSQVVWRLPYQTHHSVQLDELGHLWVSGQREQRERDRRYPPRTPPFDEDTVLEVSPEGRILNEWAVGDLLHDSGLDGFYFLSPPLAHPVLRDDIVHLNDVEPFPASMAEGFFRHGDVMVSLRNINTVLVFDRHTGRIRYVSTGRFIRQHDPDFIDGNRYSVFDNNTRRRHPFAAITERHGTPDQSRIMIVTAPGDDIEVPFEGTPAYPFSSSIMGKHQWLDNGNLLVTDSMVGRAFEVDGDGEVVWEYYNYIADGVVGIVEEVQRLPPSLAALFESAADPNGSGASGSTAAARTDGGT
jgi:hypothetical protein